MQSIQVYYISLSGNTTSFLERINHYLKETYQKTVTAVNVKDFVRDNQSASFKIDSPYVAFLPAYLEGGNGLDNGYEEILTTPLRDLIAYQDNRKNCLGIVGSGNRNFNKQFCLTAYQYAEAFDFPVLDTYELRGTQEDVVRIGDKLVVLFEGGEQ